MLDTMILRPTPTERSVDFKTVNKMYTGNRDSSRVSSITIPYLSASKKLKQTAAEPAIRNSGRSRFSVRDIIDQECCVLYAKASLDSSTKSLLPATTKITVATCGSSSLRNDKQLVKSKIVVKRLNDAATIVQALARRMIQRKSYQQAHIAKVETEMQASSHKAATRMQALRRGVMFRTSFHVTKLEHRLLLSDRLLKSQLENIQKDKERQIAAICKECISTGKLCSRKPMR
jgi:hypothetical protein